MAFNVFKMLAKWFLFKLELSILIVFSGF